MDRPSDLTSTVVLTPSINRTLHDPADGISTPQQQSSAGRAHFFLQEISV
jgi:hypothetical protein